MNQSNIEYAPKRTCEYASRLHAGKKALGKLIEQHPCYDDTEEGGYLGNRLLLARCYFA
jgi:hypothetical protein